MGVILYTTEMEEIKKTGLETKKRMVYIINTKYNIVKQVGRVSIDEVKKNYSECLSNPDNVVMYEKDYMAWRNDNH